MTETTAPEVTQDLAKAERQRLIKLVFDNSTEMTTKYKTNIHHTGSLLSASMTYAYSKALNDVIKLLMKETT